MSLVWGPQGSILGPILFSLNLLPLESILRKYNIGFYWFADDTQLHLPLKHTSSMAPFLCCLEEIKVWMSVNFLTFNEHKTEVILLKPGGS